MVIFNQGPFLARLSLCSRPFGVQCSSRSLSSWSQRYSRWQRIRRRPFGKWTWAAKLPKPLHMPSNSTNRRKNCTNYATLSNQCWTQISTHKMATAIKNSKYKFAQIKWSKSTNQTTYSKILLILITRQGVDTEGILSGNRTQSRTKHSKYLNMLFRNSTTRSTNSQRLVLERKQIRNCSVSLE